MDDMSRITQTKLNKARCKSGCGYLAGRAKAVVILASPVRQAMKHKIIYFRPARAQPCYMA